jgi:hypothetical protein
MIRPICIFFSVLGLACSSDDHTHSGDSGTPGSGDCISLEDSHWTMTGSAFGMNMDADLTVTADGCSFSFSNWNMNMDVPDGGFIEDEILTLTGSSNRNWGECEGIASPTEMAGQCGDGSTFTMTKD